MKRDFIGQADSHDASRIAGRIRVHRMHRQHLVKRLEIIRLRSNIMIITLVLGILLLPAVVSAADTSIKVVPASIDASVGEEFGIDMVIEPGGAEIYSAQYGLIFDPTVLELVSQTAGDFLNRDGANTIHITNGFNNGSKRLEYGETRMGVKTGVTAAGTLAHVTFRVIGNQGSNLELTDVIVGNTVPEPIPVSVENGVCLVDGSAPVSTPAPTATATGSGASALTITEAVTATAAMAETASSTTEPEPMQEETSTPAPTPTAEELKSMPVSTPENAAGFDVTMACAGILIVSCALKRRKHK